MSPLSSLVGPWLERRVLIALILVAAGAWGFVELAEAVGEGESAGVDRAIMLMLRRAGDISRPIGPPALESAMRDITALGGYVIIGIVTFTTMVGLVLAGRVRQAVMVLVAVAGAALLAEGLKDLIARPRPDLVPHGVVVYTSSFPSGHATGGAATYLSLGALLARFEPQRRLKVFTLTMAVVITVLIGVSRVYLGVHWPSDVLGGWTLGASWALLCWAIAWRLQRRGDVEMSEGGRDRADNTMRATTARGSGRGPAVRPSGSGSAGRPRDPSAP